MVIAQPRSKEDILSILSTIKDPEIPVVNIEEIGMLRDVVLHKDRYEIILTPTYTGCPAMGIIQQDILATLFFHGISNATVKLVYAPAWTTDWMSDATKEKLRQFGISAPVHSSCHNFHSAQPEAVICPKCGSVNTSLISQFGSTACKALYRCKNCDEPFDYFKCH